MISDLFGDEGEVDLHIEMSYTLADTIDGMASYNRKLDGTFIGFVRLNPRIADFSKEYILSTIIHEALHVYMYYYRVEKSLEFDSKFPIYSSTGDDHAEMAENYIDKMAEVLQNYNSSLTENEAKGLAWGGLMSEEFEAWKNFDSDKRGRYGAKKLAAKFGFPNFTPCN